MTRNQFLRHCNCDLTDFQTGLYSASKLYQGSSPGWAGVLEEWWHFPLTATSSLFPLLSHFIA